MNQLEYLCISGFFKVAFNAEENRVWSRFFFQKLIINSSLLSIWSVIKTANQ